MSNTMTPDNAWNLRCPDCGGTDAIYIAATVWVRLCPDGTDATLSHNGDHEWDKGSPACCTACGFHSQVRRLLQKLRQP